MSRGSSVPNLNVPHELSVVYYNKSSWTKAIGSAATFTTKWGKSKKVVSPGVPGVRAVGYCLRSLRRLFFRSSRSPLARPLRFNLSSLPVASAFDIRHHSKHKWQRLVKHMHPVSQSSVSIPAKSNWCFVDAEVEDIKILRERYRCPHFRILVIGRANAGKTTILEKVCGVAKGTKPIILGIEGRSDESPIYFLIFGIF